MLVTNTAGAADDSNIHSLENLTQVDDPVTVIDLMRPVSSWCAMKTSGSVAHQTHCVNNHNDRPKSSLALKAD